MVHLDGYVLGAGWALSCTEVGWETLGLIQPQGISAHRCAQHLLLQLPLKKIAPDNASLFVLEELNLNSQRNSMKLHNIEHKAHEPKLCMPSDQNKIYLLKTQVLQMERKFL